MPVAVADLLPLIMAIAVAPVTLFGPDRRIAQVYAVAPFVVTLAPTRPLYLWDRARLLASPRTAIALVEAPATVSLQLNAVLDLSRDEGLAMAPVRAIAGVILANVIVVALAVPFRIFLVSEMMVEVPPARAVRLLVVKAWAMA